MFKENKEIGLIGFGEALIYIQDESEKQMYVKRKVVKNDTIIVSYKGRLYQRCYLTGVRYPYVPTNADIDAKDWQAGKLVSKAGNLNLSNNEHTIKDSVREIKDVGDGLANFNQPKDEPQVTQKFFKDDKISNGDKYYECIVANEELAVFGEITLKENKEKRTSFEKTFILSQTEESSFIYVRVIGEFTDGSYVCEGDNYYIDPKTREFIHATKDSNASQKH